MNNNTSLYKKITDFLKKEGIEYFNAMPFSECEVINERKLRDFKPESCIAFLIPYYTGEYPERNISLYSVSRDYHLFAKELEERLLDFLKDEPYFFRLFADSSPINEREVALKASLGVLGENGLIINDKYKSYVFIGEILTDAVFNREEYCTPSPTKVCISCGRCKKSCAFLRHETDFCLSALNQKKVLDGNELETVLSQKIRWGCDTCQDVCPMNKNPAITPIPFFHKDIIPILTKDIINSMTDEKFSERAYSWRGKNTILRNLEK